MAINFIFWNGDRIRKCLGGSTYFPPQGGHNAVKALKSAACFRNFDRIFFLHFYGWWEISESWEISEFWIFSSWLMLSEREIARSFFDVLSLARTMTKNAKKILKTWVATWLILKHVFFSALKWEPTWFRKKRALLPSNIREIKFEPKILKTKGSFW